jgi:hypothetical protein
VLFRARQDHLKGKAGPVSSPSVQSEDITTMELLLFRVFEHVTADLRESGTHKFTEIALCTVLAYILKPGFTS